MDSHRCALESNAHSTKHIIDCNNINILNSPILSVMSISINYVKDVLISDKLCLFEYCFSRFYFFVMSYMSLLQFLFCLSRISQILNFKPHDRFLLYTTCVIIFCEEEIYIIILT